VILRGAVFTAERRHLGAQPSPPSVAPAAEISLDETVDHVAESGATYEVRNAELPLSSDRVASWLVTQDGATRTALASLLSDELAALRDAARDDGYARGHAEAMAEAREKVCDAVEALQKLHAHAEVAFAREAAQLQEACADVVAEVFFKLAGRALVTQEAIVAVVGEVLKRVREERELRIHVSPRDLPVLRTAETGIAASLPGRRFELVGDARVEAGGCIVQSTLGSLDGRLEVQLAGLIETLRAARDPGAGA
jgi:flagellar biosynthesis/type III secretory pathway protein FliH